MKLKLHDKKSGYASNKLSSALGDGIEITHPFVFLTGSNGTGKSSILRGIRSTIGLQGERYGKSTAMHGLEVPEPKSKKGEYRAPRFTIYDDKPAAVFDLDVLGWKGQDCYLFDSRAVSGIGNKSEFDDDMMYHVSMIIGGGKNASHGEFVGRTWFESIDWAGSLTQEQKHLGDEQKKYVGKNRSSERWLFIDEPEAAIDAEKLLVGLSILLSAAEFGSLRVFCASHSILFAAGIVNHPKVQTIDLSPGAEWLATQKRILEHAANPDAIDKMGARILEKMRGSQTKTKASPKKAKGKSK